MGEDVMTKSTERSTELDRQDMDHMKQGQSQSGRFSLVGTMGWVARIAVVAALLMLATGPVFAQAKYSFGARNQKKMIKVITLIQEEGNTEAALEILEGINLKRAKPYGRARINNMLGSLAAQDGEFEKALGYRTARSRFRE